MQVERTQPRHAPYDLGQHAEGYDDAQIGFERFERFDELRCAQLLGLQDRQTELFGRDLNVALVYLLSAAGRFVGRRDHGDDVIALGNESSERCCGELGRTHEYDA